MSATKRNLLDIAAGTVLILLAAVVYLDSYNIRVIAKTTLDAAFFPRFLAALIVVLSIVIIVRAAVSLFKKRDSFPETAQSVGEKKSITPALSTLGLFGLYVFSIESIGFLLTTPVYILCQAYVLAPAPQRNPKLFALLGVAASVIIYCIFKFGFQLMVPSGLLG